MYKLTKIWNKHRILYDKPKNLKQTTFESML